MSVMPDNFKNILIVRTDRLGDVILTMPAVRALRQRFPRARIALLLHPSTQDLVEGQPFVDEIIIDDRGREYKGIMGFVKLIRELKAKRFDLAVIYHTKKRTNLACYLAGIPHRLGYRNDKYGLLLNHPIVDIRQEGKLHEAQFCFYVLKVFGIAVPPLEKISLTVSVHQSAEQWAEGYLRQNNLTDGQKLIAVHMGASDPSRRWAEERFAELIPQMIKRCRCRIIIVGGDDMRVSVKAMIAKIEGRPADGHASILDLTGLTTMAQLTSILRRCRMLVSNDTGPVHLAAALNLPVVSIFTRNQPGINPERWKPLGPMSRFIAIPLDTAPDFRKAGSATLTYRGQIQVSDVLEEVDALWKLC